MRMNILAIETSMGCASAALALVHGGEARIVSRRGGAGRGQAETLFSLIASAMTEAGVGYGDLDLLAATRGPGGFSGVRAGIAAVRGFRLALGLPVAVVSTLELMAFAATRRPDYAGTPFLIAAHAGAGHAFTQGFDAKGAPLSDAAILPLPEAWRSAAPGIETVAGPAAATLSECALAAGGSLHVWAADLEPDAGDLAAMALGLKAEAHPPSPLYLRPPDAKPQRNALLARAGEILS
jgi:tRNA threonylcarbamoyladenosine biosynthesis protein TsaB